MSDLREALKEALDFIRSDMPTPDSYAGELIARLAPLTDTLDFNGTVTERSAVERERKAFLHGAKWWEFESTKGTMWQSDQHKTWDEATRRYPLPKEE